MALDRVFRKRKPIGDELVGVPSRNQPQDLYLASGQRIVDGVVGELCGHLLIDALAAGMHVPDGVQKLLLQQALEQDACAPALSARIAWTSPLYVVKTMTRASGNSLRMAMSASMPSTSGICTSISVTSGR